MTEYGAHDLMKLMQLDPEDDIDVISMEVVIDSAIGLLNLLGASIPDMTGTEGVKKMDVTSSAWSAICQAARMVYIDFIEDAGGDVNVQGMSQRARNLLTDPDSFEILRQLAGDVVAYDDDPYDDIKLI
jgi:hypothetical protein